MPEDDGVLSILHSELFFFFLAILTWCQPWNITRIEELVYSKVDLIESSIFVVLVN